MTRRREREQRRWWCPERDCQRLGSGHGTRGSVCLSVCPPVSGSVRLSARGLPAWEPHTEAAGARAQGSVLCVEPELWKW